MQVNKDNGFKMQKKNFTAKWNKHKFFDHRGFQKNIDVDIQKDYFQKLLLTPNNKYTNSFDIFLYFMVKLDFPGYSDLNPYYNLYF